jgi:beta-galactosidase
VFAPVLYVLSRAQADRIREYVRGGGVFVTSFRLGVKIENSQIVRTPLPGFLADVMGVTVEDYVPIYSQPPHVKFSAMLEGPEAECGIWADILKPTSAEVLGTYSTGEHASKAAVTMNSFGKGKAIYMGADLHPQTLARVLQTFSATAGVKPPLSAPIGVEVTSRASGEKRWIFILNHSAEPKKLALPGSFKDLIAGETLSGEIDLTGYAVRVLQPT